MCAPAGQWLLQIQLNSHFLVETAPVQLMMAVGSSFLAALSATGISWGLVLCHRERESIFRVIIPPVSDSQHLTVTEKSQVL